MKKTLYMMSICATITLLAACFLAPKTNYAYPAGETLPHVSMSGLLVML